MKKVVFSITNVRSKSDKKYPVSGMYRKVLYSVRAYPKTTSRISASLKTWKRRAVPSAGSRVSSTVT